MRSRHLLPKYRIAVVGAGAIGLYYGGKLASFGREVHFLLRRDYETIRKQGLRLQSKSENIHVAKVLTHLTTTEIGICDLILVAIKTTTNSDLPALLSPLVGPETMILTLQNGLGNEEFLASHFGAQHVLGGLCFICLNHTAPGVVQRIDSGRMRLGEFQDYPLPRTHDVSWEFKRCGMVSTVVADLILERWRKLVWNIPFNGLTIISGGLDTRALLADDHWHAETVALMDEVIQIANELGYKIPTSFGLELIKETKSLPAYKPSTLLDYEAGQPLELEAIWGEPWRRARAAGVSAPRLERLFLQLKTLAAVNSTE